MSADAAPASEGPPPIERRTFLGALPLVVASTASLQGCLGDDAAAGGASDPTARGARPLETVGLQLYTVRDRMAADFDGTLEQIAAIGYRELELAGLYGRSPEEMRAALDGHGLRAVSSHQSLDEVRGDWGRTLEGAVALGQELIVVPGIPGPERSPESLRRVADDFDRAGEAARSAGLRFGYHNHDWEMTPLPDGTRLIDLLLERTDSSLVDWQMDIFWTVHGGADPAIYLRDAAGRVTSVHVKDRTADGRMVDVGDGVIDFAGLLDLSEELGLLHAFVEHDAPSDALVSVRRSYEHLVALIG